MAGINIAILGRYCDAPSARGAYASRAAGCVSDPGPSHLHFIGGGQADVPRSGLDRGRTDQINPIAARSRGGLLWRGDEAGAGIQAHVPTVSRANGTSVQNIEVRIQRAEGNIITGGHVQCGGAGVWRRQGQDRIPIEEDVAASRQIQLRERA